MTSNMRKIRLFCFPYAGGSSAIYRSWANALGNTVEITPVELPGRGIRFKEPFYKSIEDAVNNIYDSIRNDLDQNPYAFFGHSMGSIIAFELAHKLKDFDHPDPVHIFFSGRLPPHIESIEDKNAASLPDFEFIKYIKDIGGTPDDVFCNEGLLEVFLPILRSDFWMVHNYQFVPKSRKLDSDITVLFGSSEGYNESEIGEWSEYSNLSCNTIQFEGGHFFIHSSVNSVLKYISDILNSYLCY